jgi:hypothetical protein
MNLTIKNIPEEVYRQLKRSTSEKWKKPERRGYSGADSGSQGIGSASPNAFFPDETGPVRRDPAANVEQYAFDPE